jgi:transcriptional regulator with XRE-family HTH domain
VSANPLGGAAKYVESGVGFAETRELIECALALADSDDGGEPVFPPVARRFLQAREALGLKQSEVARKWGQQPSMYWDLELYDFEAFDVISVQDLVTLAAVLRVSVTHLLFGEEASSRLPTTSYSEIVRRLRAQMDDRAMSVEQMSELVGWELAEYLDDPDKLAELPIVGLRWVCKAADVDWATTLANPTARLTTG